MSAEKELREAWAVFVEKARAAHLAGYDVRLPFSVSEALAISETSRRIPDPVEAKPEEEPAPKPDFEIPSFASSKGRKKDV